MSFGSDLRRITEARKLDLNKASRGVTIRVFDAVARDTRVDKGRLRANWLVGVGAPNTATTEITDQNTGAPLRASQKKKIKPMALNYLSNSLPYAEVWEIKDGMVAGAVADILRLLKAEVESLK